VPLNLLGDSSPLMKDSRDILDAEDGWEAEGR
jgi:hypothetical protein